ncbi:hypothetical protein K438DRAFT_1972638 [Mycena galopus ATCC 62051]|nr:hypothetical protein K438DRAFT_1972638 [Mycena galopus ATCC 62051]
MAARLPPATKLSLTVRKNGALDLLGASWTFDFAPLAIYPYAESQNFAKDQPGTVLRLYMEGALTELRHVVEVYDDAGKTELNAVVPAHTIQLDVGEPAQIIRNTYIGAAVVDGALRILFAADEFGTNAHSAFGEPALFPALNAVGDDAAGLTFLARMGISKNYPEKADAAHKKLAGMLQRTDIVLDPNFAEVFGRVREESRRPGNEIVATPQWELEFGRSVGNYFEAMAYQIEVLGFGTDDMLREAFNESVQSGVVKVRIVDALKRLKYCEAEIEDGVLYLQTTLGKWGWNTDGVGSDITDLL